MIKLLAAVVFLSLFISSPDGLLAQTSFYQGKTITIIVGTVPGGLYDRWGVCLAESWGNYIPGNPSIVVQNMPGGGSMIAANYLYGVAKPSVHARLQWQICSIAQIRMCPHFSSGI